MLSTVASYSFENIMVLELKTLRTIESQKVPAEDGCHPGKLVAFPLGKLKSREPRDGAKV